MNDKNNDKNNDKDKDKDNEKDNDKENDKDNDNDNDKYNDKYNDKDNDKDNNKDNDKEKQMEVTTEELIEFVTFSGTNEPWWMMVHLPHKKSQDIKMSLMETTCQYILSKRIFSRIFNISFSPAQRSP